MGDGSREGGGGANGKNTLPALLYFHHGSRQHVSPRDTARGERALFLSFTRFMLRAYVTKHTIRADE